MADIAQLGFAADTSALKDAKASLDALVPAADRSAKSSQKLSNTLNKMDGVADKLAAAAGGLSSAVSKMEAVLSRTGATAVNTAASFGNLSTANAKVAVSFNSVTSSATGVTTATNGIASAASSASSALNSQGASAASTAAQMDNLDSHVEAYRANLRQMKIDQMAAGAGMGQLDAHVLAFRDHIDKAGGDVEKTRKAIKFTATDSLNAFRQLSDIGTTAAMGMSPFMIAVQQGPQLLDILQNKAAVTGQTLGAVFKAAGAAIWSALAPILPIIIAIAAAVGLVAAGFGLATRAINQSSGDISKSMDLTDKQLKRVKKSGVDTSVTIADTFTATFQVLGERITDLFAKPIKATQSTMTKFLNALTGQFGGLIKSIVATFSGAYSAIIALWKNMPSTFSGIAALIGNAFIAMFETVLNRAVDQVNGITKTINNGLKSIGIDAAIPVLSPVKFGRIANTQAAQAADAISKGFAEGYARGEKATDRFFADVGKKARANRRKIIQEAAGDAEKGPKDKKGPKTDAEKFDSIVRGAENDIAKEKAREAAASVTMTAEAAATLEFRTKLLNEAQTKNIKLTDAMRGKIDELAAAYGKAKVAADNAIALRDVLKASDADIAGIKAQADMVGLYGRQLAYATEMAKLLGEAKAKGMTPDAIAAARPQFEAKANEYADASATLANKQFTEEMTRTAKERMIVLATERASIGLSADETTRFRIENELLAQARQKNIDLSPAELAAIRGIASEQANAENAIRKTREALDFAKDATKGFFSDLRSNLQQGQTLWESFGNAVMGVLNKIIAKLTDKLLDSAIDNLFRSLSGNGSQQGSSGGGGFLNALLGNLGGGLFGKKQTPGISENPNAPTAFAKGSGFSNSIVSRPTMFAFGKGGSNLGIMGEKDPEAVMPLQRGPDGSLGVQMYGGNGGGTVIHAPITVKNDNRVSGAVSSQDIVELQRRSAEQTTRDIKRQIPEFLQQYQRDGAVV